MVWHYLKGNKTTRFPTNLAFLDVDFTERTEEGPQKTTIREYRYATLLMARLSKGKLTRYAIKQSQSPGVIAARLFTRTERRRPLRVYAWDVPQALALLGVWELVDRGIWQHRFTVDGDPPVLSGFNTNRGPITFCDLRNWYRESYNDFCERYIVANHDEWELDDAEECSDNDCTIRARCVAYGVVDLITFVAEHDLGNFKTTLAGQAMAAYRHRFAPRQQKTIFAIKDGVRAGERQIECCLPCVHDSADVKSLERKGYYGGYSDCFFIGEIRNQANFFGDYRKPGEYFQDTFMYGPVYQVDCNGLYPYVMKTRSQPIQLVDVGNGKGKNPNEVGLCWPNAIATVTLNAKCSAYPVRQPGKVTYCLGKFQTTLAGPELHKAVYDGEVTGVHEWAVYELGFPFTAYVDAIQQIRLLRRAESDHAFEEIAKLLLNALYGKWAERRQRWESRPDEPAPCRWGRWYAKNYATKIVTDWRAIAGHVEEKVTVGELEHSFPAISAWITSDARLYMEYVRLLAGKCCTLYQGVDSLILTESGYAALHAHKLIDPAMLGGFKLVAKADTGAIINVNHYRLGDRHKTSGLPGNAVKIAKDVYTWEAREGMAGMLSRFPSRRISLSEVSGTFNKSYDAGTVSATGWTSPHVL